jgi:methylenetetrahydrofolate reductase (NADPH)
MLRVFQADLLDPKHFVVTVELVPGRESLGRSVDLVKGIAMDAFKDGRISAVSITDNPGGNPSLSPDVIAHEIFSVGMDVIVHFACRDMNRAAMESRALQLAMMGIKNILALTGDYTSRGFGGPGAPVFDLDSVNLLFLLNLLSERIQDSGDPDEFFPGASVSPFKYSEGESFAQYAKLRRKVAAGAQFIITQLGYDVKKFAELHRILRSWSMDIPVLGSVYLLSPRAARAMNRGAVPGAFVSDELLSQVLTEWKSPREGLALAIERTARLAAILKGIGYRGIHLGGIHRSFSTIARILDRMEEIEKDWRTYLPDFDFTRKDGFYAFPEDIDPNDLPKFGQGPKSLSLIEKGLFHFLKWTHRYFFDFQSPIAHFLEKSSRVLDRHRSGRLLTSVAEGIPKKVLLDCQVCGDCCISQAAFLCPESQCPKHIRNGACGGSHDTWCEVYPDRHCVWFRAYQRWASVNRIDEMAAGCVPPRMWELDQSSSWLNFHLKRDHHSSSNRVAQFCRTQTCALPKKFKTEKT